MHLHTPPITSGIMCGTVRPLHGILIKMEHFFARLLIELCQTCRHEERILHRRRRGHRHPLRRRPPPQEHHPARARHALEDLKSRVLSDDDEQMEQRLQELSDRRLLSSSWAQAEPPVIRVIPVVRALSRVYFVFSKRLFIYTFPLLLLLTDLSVFVCFPFPVLFLSLFSCDPGICFIPPLVKPTRPTFVRERTISVGL